MKITLLGGFYIPINPLLNCSCNFNITIAVNGLVNDPIGKILLVSFKV